MPGHLGSANKWAALYLGSTSMARAYIGSTLFFEKDSGGPTGIINGDGSSGTTNWTALLGNPPNSELSSAYSSYGFPGSTMMGGGVQARQDIINGFYDIPSGLLSSAATGNLELTLEVNSASTSGSRTGNVRVEYWDDFGGGGNFLGYQMVATLVSGPASGHNNNIYTLKIPAGTKSYAYLVLGRRNAGGVRADQWFFQLLQGTLAIITGGRDKIWADKGHDITGWTVTTGSIASTGSFNTWSSWGSRFGGSQARLTYYREVLVSSLSAQAQAAIAAGTATYRVQRVAWATNASDRSRTYIESRTLADSILSTVQDAGSPTAWATDNSSLARLDVFIGTAAIPSGTQKFRIWQDFQRADGTVNDARIGMLDVAVEW